MSELELDDVPPTSHPLDVVNAWRDDEPRPSWPLERTFENAPLVEDDAFRVPPTGAVRES